MVGNNITSSGAMELGEGILRSRSLMELDLNGMLGDDFLAI
jgi:hypothetical protein